MYNKESYAHNNKRSYFHNALHLYSGWPYVNNALRLYSIWFIRCIQKASFSKYFRDFVVSINLSCEDTFDIDLSEAVNSFNFGAKWFNSDGYTPKYNIVLNIGTPTSVS